jgi:hypothetical protein
MSAATLPVTTYGHFTWLFPKSHDEIVFRQLCHAAHCNPLQPQEIVDIFSNLRLKKKALRESKEAAEARLARITKAYQAGS